MSSDCTTHVGTSMFACICLTCLQAYFLIVELVLIDGVERCRGEGCSDLSDRHLTVVANLLHINMERDKLEEGTADNSLSPLFHGGDPGLLLGKPAAQLFASQQCVSPLSLCNPFRPGRTCC